MTLFLVGKQHMYQHNPVLSLIVGLTSVGWDSTVGGTGTRVI